LISEITNYLVRIEDLRNQISSLIFGLPEQALNWRPIEGDNDHATNSLAVLTAHIAGAEHFWIAEVVGKRPETRNRESEFAAKANNAIELIRILDETALETRDVFSTLTESDLNDTRQARDRKVQVRWCLLHVVDHTALHLGHMQITYQLWSGGKSIHTPLWFDRLPPNQEF
jgi:uncharacterized damage-inducible protein DinB